MGTGEQGMGKNLIFFIIFLFYASNMSNTQALTSPLVCLLYANYIPDKELVKLFLCFFLSSGITKYQQFS